MKLAFIYPSVKLKVNRIKQNLVSLIKDLKGDPYGTYN